MTEWIDPLIATAIFYAVGALGGLGAMAGKESITILGLCRAVFEGGASGAVGGLIAHRKLIREAALATAFAAGLGWIGKEAIAAAIIKGLSTIGNKPPDEKN